MNTWVRMIGASAAAATAVLLAGCAGSAGPGSGAQSTRVTAPLTSSSSTSGVAGDSGTPIEGPTTTGSSTGAGSADAATGDLFGRFGVTSVVGHEVVPGTAITLTFEGSQLGVSAGCNTMSGQYSVEDDTLVVDTLISTMMACEEPKMAQEQWVSAFLSAKPRVEQSGEEMVLTGRGVVPETMTLHLTTVEPTVPSDGEWVLSTIVRGDIASSPPSGVTATLTLDGGSLVLSAGCNTMRATVTRTDDTMTVPGLASTRKACPPDQAQLETLFTDTFAGDLAVVTDGALLRVSNSSTATQLLWQQATAVTTSPPSSATATPDNPATSATPVAPTAPTG